MNTILLADNYKLSKNDNQIPITVIKHYQYKQIVNYISLPTVLIDIIVNYIIEEINLRVTTTYYDIEILHDKFNMIINRREHGILLIRAHNSICNSIYTDDSHTDHLRKQLLKNTNENSIHGEVLELFNQYTNDIYKISNYINNHNMPIRNNDPVFVDEIQLNYDKKTYLRTTLNNINRNNYYRIFSIEDQEQFENIIQITKLFFDLL